MQPLELAPIAVEEIYFRRSEGRDSGTFWLGWGENRQYYFCSREEIIMFVRYAARRLEVE